MHVFKIYRFSTSVVTFKLVFYIILVKGALCIQNQGSKSANTTKTNDTETNIFENSTLIKNSPVGNLSDRKESNSQSPIPLEKITESEKSKKHVFEKDTIYETISPVHEVEQHLTTASNQWIQIPESIEESAGFRPSIHLGEIGEVNFTGIIMKPFNKIQQLGFQKIVNTEANHGSHPRLIRQKLVKFYDTDDRYKPEAIKLQPIPLSEYFHNLQNLHNSESNEHLQNEHVETHYVDKEPIEGMKIIHGILSMRPMKFVEENYNLGTTERPYHQVNLEKPYHLVNFEIPYHPVNAEEAHHQVNVETPHSLERPHVVFGNSVKFPNEERFSQPFYTHNHEYNSPLQFEHIEKPKFEFEHIKKPEFEHIKKPEFEFEHIKKPEFEFDQFKKPELEYEKFPNLEIEYDKFKKPGLGLEYYKQPELNCEYSRRPEILVDSFQSEEHGNTENLEKPHNVAYVTTYETTRTRTKKFPYQFYQPMFLSEVPYLHEEHLHEDVSNEKRFEILK